MDAKISVTEGEYRSRRLLLAKAPEIIHAALERGGEDAEWVCRFYRFLDALKPGQYVRLSATPERLPLMLATAALYVTESGNWQEYELNDHLTAIRRKVPFTPSGTPVRKRKWPE